MGMSGTVPKRDRVVFTVTPTGVCMGMVTVDAGAGVMMGAVGAWTLPLP